jgi:hypothetical protein
MLTPSTRNVGNGWMVLGIWRGATIYLRIPSEIAVPIDGGCHCDYCKSNPHLTPAWDTLGVPLTSDEPKRAWYSWTLHMPDTREFSQRIRREGK